MASKHLPTHPTLDNQTSGFKYPKLLHLESLWEVGKPSSHNPKDLLKAAINENHQTKSCNCLLGPA